MLLTIHNLPLNIRYNDIKSMLHSKCGLSDVILDNLETEGSTRKVTVGLADESDAAILVRKINGLYLAGQQLFVENVRQKKASEQPYHSKDAFSFTENSQVDSYQHGNIPPHDYERDTWDKYQNGDRAHTQLCSALPRDAFEQADHTQQLNAFQKSNFLSNEPYMGNQTFVAADPMPVMMNMAPMYYMPAVATANSLLDYGGQAQQIAPKVHQNTETRVQKDTSFDFGVERRVDAPQNRARDWGHDNNTRYGDRQRQPSPKRGRAPVDDFSDRRESRWDTPKKKTHDVETRRHSPQPAQFNSREPFFVQNKNSDTFVAKNVRDQDYSRNRDSGYGQRLQGRSETFSSNDFGDPMMSSPADHLPSSNAFGIHVTNNPVRAGPAPVWEVRDVRKQREDPQSFQTRGNRGQPRREEILRRDNEFRPRNDRRPPRVELEPPQFRNSDRGGPRPVKTIRGAPTKRFPDSRNERDEPQPKRFAGSKPPFEFPKPWAQGSQNSQNMGPKPGKGSVLSPKPGSFRVNQQASQPKSGPNIPPSHMTPSQLNKGGKPTKPLSLSSLLNRDQTWRSQAAAQIAKDILKNLEITNIAPRDEILVRMKSTIRSRIEVMVGDTLSVPMLDLVQRYREKYPAVGDRVFFQTLLEEVKKDSNEEGATKKKQPAPVPKDVEVAKNNKAAEDMIAKAKNVVKVPVLNPVPASEKLPKYVNADKSTYKQIKNIQKRELQEDNMYELPPDLQKALDEECDILCDLFMAECEVPDQEQEKEICERISDQAADDFRKLVRLNITKRLLNVNTHLMVRIFSDGPPPKREPLEAFLKQYGVLSLKKSDKSKMFIAHFNSYANYDTLCTLGSAEIGGIRVQFKPLHVAGPPQKVTRAQIIAQREKRIQIQIERNAESLLKKPDEIKQTELNTAKPGEPMVEKTGQELEKTGQELEKTEQELEKTGQELKKTGQEQDYADEDEIDQDLEEVVKEYAHLDYVPEDEENTEIKLELKEDTFYLDDNDLEDY